MWKCDICYDNTQCPMVLDGCGHSYYNSCVRHLNNICPECRKSFKNVVPNILCAKMMNLNIPRFYNDETIFKHFKEMCKKGDLTEIKKLISDGVDATADDNYAIRYASERGHLEVVKFLSTLPNVDATANNCAIQLASSNGHLEVVKFLSTLPGVDASAQDNEAINNAILNGHLEVVKFLASLPKVDASDQDNQAIKNASICRHKQIVDSYQHYPESIYKLNKYNYK